MTVPARTEDLDVASSAYFLTVPLRTALAALTSGHVPVMSAMLASSTLLGVEAFNRAKADRQLPPPFAGSVGDCLEMSVTPLTRAAYGSVTGMVGAAKVARDDMVVLCATRQSLRSAGNVLVYVDRMASRRDAQFDGDPALLERAAWYRIQNRDIRSSSADPDELARYDAAVLVRGGIPTSALTAVICRNDNVAGDIRQHLTDAKDKVLVNRAFFW